MGSNPIECASYKESEYMKDEIWKDIPGFEGQYQASNLGRIKRLERFSTFTINKKQTKRFLKEKILKTKLGNCKYLLVSVGNKWRLCHRLVAITFIPTADIKLDVNHKDFDRHNNAVENLEWMTRKENHLHSRNAGRYLKADKIHSRVISMNNKSAKLNANDIKEIRIKRVQGIKPKELSKQYGVNVEHIYLICSKKVWKYIE